MSMYGPYRRIISVGKQTATGTIVTLECGHTFNGNPTMDFRGEVGNLDPCTKCKAEGRTTLDRGSADPNTKGTLHDIDRAARSPVLRPIAEITTEPGRIHVNVVWTGVALDRPSTGGWGLGANEMKLAQRLKRAIDAGAVLVDPEVKEDVYGQTFVSATSRVLGRRMNADLVRLGF